MSHENVSSTPHQAPTAAQRPESNPPVPDASTLNRDSTLNELYHVTLERASRFTAMSKDKSRSDQIRDHFDDRAHSLECAAGYLAHCLAWFGNVKLAEFDIEAAKIEVSGKCCGQCNPWARGLAAIEAEVCGHHPNRN